MVELTLVRRTSYADYFREYKIKVDGEICGTIRRNESVVVQVPEGEHALWLSIDWCSSNRLTMRFSGSAPLKFECGSSLAGWRILLGAFYVVLLPGSYLWLRASAAAV